MQLKTACLALLLLSSVALPTAPVSASRLPTPAEAIPAILDAFRTHEIVAVTDPHGNIEVQAFLLSLIRDSRFPNVVDDIVIEPASARHQDVLDRFVRGDDVSRDALRKVWEEHTVPTGLGVHAEGMIRAVRAINGTITNERKLRVIGGDPPIDWDNVISRQDHARWIELRDSYPADLIRRQVLDRGRRALVIYGQGHLQRRQVLSNYDMSTWQSQTLVSLLERAPTARIFNIWTLLDENVALPAGVESWAIPTLASLKGTILGAADVATYSRDFGFGNRFAVQNGQLVPLRREEWKMMRMEDQFDAVLYLGPPKAMTHTRVSAALCQDSEFLNRRLERLRRFGPPVEVENLKKSCGL